MIRNEMKKIVSSAAVDLEVPKKAVGAKVKVLTDAKPTPDEAAQ
jgi:hypothetical protein